MAVKRLTDLTPFSGTLADDDVVHLVDISDTSQNAAGSSFKFTAKGLREGLTANKQVKTADFTVENGISYLVDATTGAIVATVPVGVEIFTIGDFANTWTATKTVSVDIGTDTFLFNDTNSQKEFVINKDGTTFRVYRDGTFIEVGNI